MPRRSVDLEAERKRAHKPGAGHPIKKPAKDPTVANVDRYAKDRKKHPAQQTGYVPPRGKKLDTKKFMEEVRE